MNEVLKALKERRSCRKFQPCQLAPEDLDAILEAGTYAPTGRNLQAPVIVVIQDAETIAEISRLNAAVMGVDTDPFYGAPTLLVVLAIGACIGLITGFVAHKILHVSKHTDNKKKLTTRAAIAGACGLLFNCIFDPLLGYYYKLLILGKPAAELTLAWNIGATAINAVTSTIVATAVYVVLIAAMKKAGLFRDILK